jgi:hypothetical protein
MEKNQRFKWNGRVDRYGHYHRNHLEDRKYFIHRTQFLHPVTGIQLDYSWYIHQ